jgi:hypothetical protein
MNCLLAIALVWVHTAAAFQSSHAAKGRVSVRLQGVRSPRDQIAQQLRQVGQASAPLLLTLFTPLIARAQKGYLTEPTKEFNAEVAKTAALAAERIKLRAKWDDIISRFEATNDTVQMEKILTEMRAYLVNLNGVPPDYKKMDLVKICRGKKLLNPENKRSKKTKPEWTKDVEIAYQALIFEYNKQQLPNNKPEPDAA